MKKILLLLTILFMSVITTACINTFAVQELNNKATEYMNKGDVEAAICRLKASLDLDDSIYQTHYNLGVAYISAGRYDDAINELERTIALKETFYNAYYSKAIALENKAYTIMSGDEEEEMPIETVVSFVNALQDAIDAFNTYLVKNVEAKETAQVNDKISEINNKIKKMTDRYDVASFQEEGEEASYDEYTEETTEENQESVEQPQEEASDENQITEEEAPQEESKEAPQEG